MSSLFIGILSGLIIIPLVWVLVRLLKPLNEKLLYGLILAGIGFLYVGFTWMDWQAFLINAFQAVVFVVLAGIGMIKHNHLLAIGYILHGCWDVAYSLINLSDHLPPHYDLFCSSLDFVLAGYLFYAGRIWRRRFLKEEKIQDKRLKLQGSIQHRSDPIII